MNNFQTDIIIIGAGLAGLLAAASLQEKMRQVLVLEEGAQVGGRMATRQIQGDWADHGAQFFTVRHARFGQLVQGWLENGAVFEWSRGWGEEDGHPRYAGKGGMTAVPQYLSRSLSVHLNTRITAVSPERGGWQVLDENGNVYHGRALILTPPVPNSLALLDGGQTRLHPEDRAALERIRYAPCLTGLFCVEGGIHMPAPGAVYTPDKLIVWMANNRRKGIANKDIITVHAGPEYSFTYEHSEEAAALQGHLAALRPYLGPQAQIVGSTLIRWPFALPLALHPERTLIAQGLPPLAFAGDAFYEPRVEGAALSGLAAAGALEHYYDITS